MRELIREYRESLRALKRSRVSLIHRSSMITDTQWAIDYMETGRVPGARWTVARWSREKREVPVDPFIIARCVRNSQPSGTAPGWMTDFLERLMSPLTCREREAYDLVRGRLYSFAEAACLMGCSKGSVQNLVRRAEKKIALVVQKQTISEELFQNRAKKGLA